MGEWYVGIRGRDKPDVPAGVVRLEQTADQAVEFHPRNSRSWRPTNLAAIRLVPRAKPE
jgi:hypothetical protein